MNREDLLRYAGLVFNYPRSELDLKVDGLDWYDYLELFEVAFKEVVLKNNDNLFAKLVNYIDVLEKAVSNNYELDKASLIRKNQTKVILSDLKNMVREEKV